MRAPPIPFGPPSGGCLDKVTADNTTPVIVNMPNGFCDTYGTFTLTASAAGAAAATNLTLFRTDATGLNLMASGGHVSRGVWTTQIGAQNIPGNYVAAPDRRAEARLADGRSRRARMAAPERGGTMTALADGRSPEERIADVERILFEIPDDGPNAPPGK
jgi:hypothetical protein